MLAAGKGYCFADRGRLPVRGYEDPARVWELNWREPALRPVQRFNASASDAIATCSLMSAGTIPRTITRMLCGPSSRTILFWSPMEIAICCEI